MDLGLKGLAALVTGASRGIGSAIASQLGREGANVAIVGRDLDRLMPTARHVESLGVDCYPVVADLADPGGCRDAVQTSVSRLGGLDILVNNATVEVWTDASTGSEEAVFARWRGKTLPAVLCSQAALPHLEASGGSITFLGGLGSRMPLNRFSPFVGLEANETSLAQGLGNAAISAYAKYLSDEAGRADVRVNVVVPGVVMTERTQARIRRYTDRHGLSMDEVLEAISDGTPLNRIVTPSDVANLVVFLASPAAHAITGQAVAIDSGLGRAVMY